MKRFISALALSFACSFALAGAVDDCINQIGSGKATCQVNASLEADRTANVCAQCRPNQVCYLGQACIDRERLARSFALPIPEDVPETLNSNIIPARIDCAKIGDRYICSETKEGDLLQRQASPQDGVDI